MPILDTSIFKERSVILSGMLSALQDAIPQVYIGEDGILRIIFEIESGQLEGAYLAAQLLLEDVFPQTSSAPALKLHGDTFNIPFLSGDYADGILKFTGTGGTIVPQGSMAGADPGAGMDLLAFVTEFEVTIPNPGIATAPVASISASAGNLTGTYEYVITFITAAGETTPSVDSNAVAPVAKRVDLSNIPLGGAGTIQRKIYRQKDGVGNYLYVATLNDNTTTTYQDNLADASTGPGIPPTESTANAITVEAVADRAGTDYNVAPGTITNPMTVPAGITAVINPASFTGGTNQEDIEHYRNRLLTYLRNPRTGSVADFEFWAESVTGVASATIFENDNMGVYQPGHVTVRIAGPDGTIPAADVISATQATLDDRDVANIIVHVGTFTAVTLAITVDVTLDSGYILADVTPNVQDAVSDYIATVPIGGTAYKSGVIDAVFGLPGIIDVTTTFNNSTVGPTSKFVTMRSDVTVT